MRCREMEDRMRQQPLSTSGMSLEEMMELLIINTYRFQQKTQMRNRETEDGMRQEPSFTSDMSLEEMIYHFR